MSHRTFHKVLQQLENNYDLSSSDKKKSLLWAKRLHISLKAYRELLYTVNAMDKSNDDSVRESARVIKSNVFYTVEYREVLFQFLVHYTPLKNTKEYLIDLLDTQHIFLKMLQAYCQNNRSVVVQKKKKKSGKKKKKQGNLKHFYISDFILILTQFFFR